jgi:hypothetical protein
MTSCAMYGKEIPRECISYYVIHSHLVSAVVVFFWIHSVFCCDPSKDMEGLSHIFQSKAEEESEYNFMGCG